MRMDPSPVVALHRERARAGAGETGAALAAIETLAASNDWSAWQPFHAARAELAARLGHVATARAAFAEAIRLAKGTAERRYLEGRLAAITREVLC